MRTNRNREELLQQLEGNQRRKGYLVKSEVAQSCPTLWDPMGCSLPGFSVHGIFQAMSWSGLPFPSPGDLPNPGIEPGSPALWTDALPSEPPEQYQAQAN